MSELVGVDAAMPESVGKEESENEDLVRDCPLLGTL